MGLVQIKRAMGDVRGKTRAARRGERYDNEAEEEGDCVYEGMRWVGHVQEMRWYYACGGYDKLRRIVLLSSRSCRGLNG